RGREGTVTRLSEIGKKLGYRVEQIEPVWLDGEIVSSSRLREHILRGEIRRAAAGLGRRYSLSGVVVHGDGLGRKINIPTANLEISPEKLLPAHGVYACWAWVEGKRYRAVTNVGVRPTFTSSWAVRVETHLLDFQQSLYGQQVTVELVERLREEKKFPTVEALLAQIHADIERTRDLLRE
ncbi:MAG: hypothetical protein NZL98_08470, partial [Anaerolineales bacterium]|nr:hypothetical protein [Anaerolineales bacterium]